MYSKCGKIDNNQSMKLGEDMNNEAKENYELGLCYEEGKGVKRDLTQAIAYYKKAADLGSKEAKAKLIEIEEMEGLIENVYNQLYPNNDSEHFYNRGMHKKEINEYGEAFQCFKKASELGHVAGIYELGLCYKNGKGTTKDLDQAKLYLHQAMEANYLDAHVAYASCFLDEEGQTKGIGVLVLERAVELNSASAMVRLGQCFEYGSGVSVDLKKAFDYYELATHQNDARAFYFLARCYKEGKGCQVDLKKAEECCLKSIAINETQTAKMLLEDIQAKKKKKGWLHLFR